VSRGSNVETTLKREKATSRLSSHAGGDAARRLDTANRSNRSIFVIPELGRDRGDPAQQRRDAHAAAARVNR
jgi:hypothetical protein